MPRKMICEGGMSEAIGTLAIGETGEEVFIGREWVQNKNYSEDTARLVDAEVKRIVEEAHSRCHALLQENLETLHRIARALLERETISGEELDCLMEDKPLPPLDANGKPRKTGEIASASAPSNERTDENSDFTLEPDDAAAGESPAEKTSDRAGSGGDDAPKDSR